MCTARSESERTNAEYLVRKFDALEAKCAALENKIIPVSAELPPANESVLLFDANGEGWLIGWRSLWYTWGQKETGEWQWTFQVGTLKTSISLTGSNAKSTGGWSIMTTFTNKELIKEIKERISSLEVRDDIERRGL
ncbi:CPS-53 (KpLE1) prophage protein [Escherichia coli]|nr:CPS-53 (KpLE1) prophage protein [Escherichia coli]